jgi:hypothetical protein
MKFANATKFDRKFGVAQWRDLRFPNLRAAYLGSGRGGSTEPAKQQAIRFRLPALGIPSGVVFAVRSEDVQK